MLPLCCRLAGGRGLGAGCVSEGDGEGEDASCMGKFGGVAEEDMNVERRIL